MNAAIQWLLLSWGWRRLLAAFAAGALAAFSQAPYDLLPVLLISFPVLVLLLDGAVPRMRGRILRHAPAFSVGYAFGLGYFLVGLWWVGQAYATQGEIFGSIAPVASVLASLGLPVGLSLFYGLGGVLARLLWCDGGVRVLALAVGLGVAEYARGHVLTGFPWNLPGQALAGSAILMQVHALVGPYGATFLTILISAAPAAVLPLVAGRGDGRRTLIAAGVLLFAIAAFGGIRLWTAPAEADLPNVRLRIVQPSVPVDAPATPAAFKAAFDQLIRLSDDRSNGDMGVLGRTHVIWPETIIPGLVAQSPEQLRRIDELLPPGTSLIAGGHRSEFTEDGRAYFNTAFVFDDQGRITDSYDKVHLVPFGEYVPPVFAWAIRAAGLRSLAGIANSPYTPGKGSHTLTIPGAPPAAVLICYEIAFPGEGIDPANRPKWLMSLSDDAWFGDSAGPYQHLDLARLRAVQEGLPVIRSANNGISAVIDPYGKVMQSLAIGREGVLDARLPQPLEYTAYVNLYDWPFLIILIASTIFALLCRKNPI